MGTDLAPIVVENLADEFFQQWVQLSKSLSYKELKGANDSGGRESPQKREATEIETVLPTNGELAQNILKKNKEIFGLCSDTLGFGLNLPMKGEIGKNHLQYGNAAFLYLLEEIGYFNAKLNYKKSLFLYKSAQVWANLVPIPEFYVFEYSSGIPSENSWYLTVQNIDCTWKVSCFSFLPPTKRSFLDDSPVNFSPVPSNYQDLSEQFSADFNALVNQLNPSFKPSEKDFASLLNNCSFPMKIRVEVPTKSDIQLVNESEAMGALLIFATAQKGSKSTLAMNYQAKYCGSMAFNCAPIPHFYIYKINSGSLTDEKLSSVDMDWAFCVQRVEGVPKMVTAFSQFDFSTLPPE